MISPIRDDVVFNVPGQPIPFKRAGRRGKSSYTPPDMAAWEAKVKAAAVKAMRGAPPFSGDVAINLTFYRKDNRRADLDNLTKCVMDALNKTVYNDDNQVIHITADVWYGGEKVHKQKPGVSIAVYQRSRLS